MVNVAGDPKVGRYTDRGEELRQLGDNLSFLARQLTS